MAILDGKASVVNNQLNVALLASPPVNFSERGAKKGGLFTSATPVLYAQLMLI